VYRHYVCVVRVDAVARSVYRVVVETLCRRVPGCVFVWGWGGEGFYGCFCFWQGCQKLRLGVFYDCHLGGYWRQSLRECEIFPVY